MSPTRTNSNEALKDAVDLWMSDNGLAVDTYGPIEDWDTSMITDMSDLFYGATAFNGDISQWNVSSATNLNSMFAEATEFNGDISQWDVSSVTNMNKMFNGATAFEQTLCWDLTNVSEIDSMFDGSSGGGLGYFNDPKCGKNDEIESTVFLSFNHCASPTPLFALQYEEKRALPPRSMGRFNTSAKRLSSSPNATLQTLQSTTAFSSLRNQGFESSKEATTKESLHRWECWT